MREFSECFKKQTPKGHLKINYFDKFSEARKDYEKTILSISSTFLSSQTSIKNRIFQNPLVKNGYGPSQLYLLLLKGTFRSS